MPCSWCDQAFLFCMSSCFAFKFISLTTNTHNLCSFIYSTLKPGAGMLFSKSSAAVALSWPVNSGNEGRYIPLFEAGGAPWSSIVINITLTCSIIEMVQWAVAVHVHSAELPKMRAALKHLKFVFIYVANGKIIQNCTENVHGGLLEPLVAIVISFDIIWMSNNPKKHTIQQSICCLFTTWYYSAKRSRVNWYSTV